MFTSKSVPQGNHIRKGKAQAMSRIVTAPNNHDARALAVVELGKSQQQLDKLVEKTKIIDHVELELAEEGKYADEAFEDNTQAADAMESLMILFYGTEAIFEAMKVNGGFGILDAARTLLKGEVGTLPGPDVKTPRDLYDEWALTPEGKDALNELAAQRKALAMEEEKAASNGSKKRKSVNQTWTTAKRYASVPNDHNDKE